MSDNAKKLLAILKADYLMPDGTVKFPPYPELCQKMGFQSILPLVSCIKRLFEAGKLVRVEG